MRSKSEAKACGSGPVYSTNSNPSVPIGLSHRSRLAAGIGASDRLSELMWSARCRSPRTGDIAGLRGPSGTCNRADREEQARTAMAEALLSPTESALENQKVGGLQI